MVDDARDSVASVASATGAPRGLGRFLPILQWAPHYQRAWLRPDLIAGITVAALVVPKSLGYAGIAGVPLQYGLYAAMAGALLYAFFGTARQIATGPSSALAAVAAGAVVGVGVAGDDAVKLVAAITVTSGLLFIVLRIFSMGWISQLLSKAVITGFLFGAGVQVVIGELPLITGTKASGDNSWEKLADWIGGLGDTDGATVLVGALSLIVVFGIRFLWPRIPGALVLVVGGIAASAALGLADRGIAVVGDVPAGLPAVVIPDLGMVQENFPVILTAGLSLLLIGFSQTAGDAREFASKHRYQVDINQESLAQGAANVGAGLVQGIPVSASLSASSLNDQSGAKTPVASLTTGIAVVLTMLFLAPVFSDLPEPVLGALIIEAVVMGMMDVPAMRRLYRVKRTDFWIAIAALLGVLGAGVLNGVLIGIALSLGWLVYVSAVPRMPILGHKPGTRIFSGLDAHPDGVTVPGVMIVGFDAGLFFIDADALEDRIRAAAQDEDGSPPLTLVVIDFESINYIDAQGSDKVRAINELGRSHGVELRLARVKPQVRAVLDRDGVIQAIGEERIFRDVYDAVADRLPAGGDPGEAPARTGG